jgi:serine/threonine protein kinase
VEDCYDQSIDWWSVGIILFESLFGYTPFADDEPRGVCSKIMNWNNWVDIPSVPKVSLEALSLLQGLLCPK